MSDSAAQSSPPVFLVHGPTDRQTDTAYACGAWNGAEDPETVDVVLPSGAAAPDSVTLIGELAPLGIGPDSLDFPVPLDTGAIWLPLPRALLKASRPTPSWRPVGTLDIGALIRWSSGASANKRALVRVAVIAWNQGRPHRAELAILIPA